MARDGGDIGKEFGLIVRRALAVALFLICIVLFVLWRADNPRIENLRMMLIDWASPSIQLTAGPVAAGAAMVEDFENFTKVYEQNKALRREIQRLRSWREVAQQLERENAQLRALNNLKLSDRVGYVAGEVIADSGSPFSQSVLINIGARDGVTDGAAAVDGQGLVGRIVGVGKDAARLLLLTDFSSRVPVKVLPSGRRAILTGESADAPRLSFLDNMAGVAPGDRVTTSGDGGVFPPDLFVGRVAVIGESGARIQIAADYERLEFVRVLRYQPKTAIETPGGLILGEGSSPRGIVGE